MTASSTASAGSGSTSRCCRSTAETTNATHKDSSATFDAQEATDLAREIGADAAVPLHWDMFATNLGDPAAFVAASETTVIVSERLRRFVYTPSSLAGDLYV